MDYEVLKNRMNNGTPFLRNMAVSRINALANNLEITQQQAEELLTLAEVNGLENMPQDMAARMEKVEQETTQNRQAIEALVEKRVQ